MVNNTYKNYKLRIFYIHIFSSNVKIQINFSTAFFKIYAVLNVLHLQLYNFE